MKTVGLLFAFAAAQSWAETCARMNVMCVAKDGWCSPDVDLTNGTYYACQSPYVCAGKNYTCRDKPMLGTSCQDDEDCTWDMQPGDQAMDCQSIGGGNKVCTSKFDNTPPSDGCYANGDACTMNSQCAWGMCVNGWCAGLQSGANCTDPANYMGCASNLFCWENTQTGMNSCQPRKAAGQPAVWSTWGWGYTCQSGFFTNSSGTPTCVSYDMWWGKVAVNGQCHYNDLGALSHALCMDGLYCDSTSSTCMMDNAFPSSCTLNGNECRTGLMRSSNGGWCSCNSSAGVTPMCVKDNCGQQGTLWANGQKAAMMCGSHPVPGQSGMCQSSGSYNPSWNGSCTMRAQTCNPPKSYQECTGNFMVNQYKKVLFPSVSMCGMTYNPNAAIYWPSYCSSASFTQPLFVLVAVLMALLQL